MKSVEEEKEIKIAYSKSLKRYFQNPENEPDKKYVGSVLFKAPRLPLPPFPTPTPSL